MAEEAPSLFPSASGDPGSSPIGILPYQTIKELIRAKEVFSTAEIAPDQLQPASLDLRLGATAWRVPASFMPGTGATVMERVQALSHYEVDLSRGAVLEKGCVYIVPLLERLKLSPRISAFANPKSSTGRLDIFTRLIIDGGTAFDRVEKGYEGPLFAEIAPRTFSVVVRQGTRLSQLRFRRGTPTLSAQALRRLQEQLRLVETEKGRETIREDNIGVTIDLHGEGPGALVGWRARKHADIIDLDKIAHYAPRDFWEPIEARAGGTRIILNPDDFYILATKEAVRVPPEYAAEMVAYDTMVGEFRVHYAGFFDPGFGWEGTGSRAVLEVRSHEVPFILEHEQVVGWLRYEKLTQLPDRLYGKAIGSSYQNQGLTLAKQFRAS